MVHLTVRGERLNIGTSKAPHTNEFRLGKLKNKVQTYLALLQASLLGSFQHGPSPPRLLPLHRSGTLIPPVWRQVKGGHSALCSGGLDI